MQLDANLRQQLRTIAEADRRRGAEMLVSPTTILALLDAIAQHDHVHAVQRGFDDLHALLPGDADIWTKVEQLKADLADRIAKLHGLQLALDHAITRGNEYADALIVATARIAALNTAANVQWRRAIAAEAVAKTVDDLRAEVQRVIEERDVALRQRDEAIYQRDAVRLSQPQDSGHVEK